MKVHDKAGSMF